MDLTELLSQISQSPDFVDSLDKDGLLEAADALSGYVTEKATAIKDGSSDDPQADLAAGKEARERLDRVQVRLAEISAAEEKTSAEAAALLDGLPEKGEAAAPEPPATPETVEDVEEEPALVAAKPSLGKIAARKPRDTDPPQPERPNALVASLAPNVPGPRKVESGLDIAKAALSQHKKLGSLTPSGLVTYPIANFDVDHGYAVEHESDHDFTVVGQMKKDAETLARADIDRLLGRPLSALVAAIPVPCGPFEPLFDYFSVSSRHGLIRLPTANARRGGLIYPTPITQVDIAGDTDWDDAVAVPWDDAAPKPFFLVECGTTFECVVQPYPTRLRFRNWEQRFNPEYVAAVLAETMIFQAHKMNAAHIAAIKALATNTALTGFGGGAVVSLANTLAFAAARLRETYKASQTAPVTVLAPAWVLDALATDLITRQATVSFDNARARAAASLAAFDLDVQ